MPNSNESEGANAFQVLGAIVMAGVFLACFFVVAHGFATWQVSVEDRLDRLEKAAPQKASP